MIGRSKNYARKYAGQLEWTAISGSAVDIHLLICTIVPTHVDGGAA